MINCFKLELNRKMKMDSGWGLKAKARPWDTIDGHYR